MKVEFGEDSEKGNYLEVSSANTSNYNNWIIETFQPYFGDHILEVGAGIGNLSTLIHSKLPDNSRFSTIEPSVEMFKKLRSRLEKTKIDVDIYNGIIQDHKDTLKIKGIDTMIYINVLEHIENDILELKICHDILKNNGYLLIFVPALEELYSPRDTRVGHYRRYYKNELNRKLSIAGFKVISNSYFDFIGSFLWFIKFRLLNSKNIQPQSVGLYDKLVIPLEKNIERVVKPPFGKNLIVVAQKI